MRFLKVAGMWLLLLLLFAVVVHYGLHMHVFTPDIALPCCGGI